MALSKDAILSAGDLTPTPMDVPEWGGVIYIRSLTGGEWDACEMERASVRKRPSEGHYAAHVCVRGIVDENGKPLFAVTDFEKLQQRNLNTIQRVALAILELSGATANAQGDIEKN